MKTDQRVLLTKRLIKEGLLQLMENKPLEKISISELCIVSGINRATFYRHYELPRDVLTEIEDDLINGLQYDTWDIRTLADIGSFSEKILEYIQANADLLRLLLKYKSDEHISRMISGMCKLTLKVKCAPLNEIEMDADFLRLYSAYTVGGIHYLLKEWLVEGIEKTPKEMSDTILRFIDAGIRMMGENSK